MGVTFTCSLCLLFLSSLVETVPLRFGQSICNGRDILEDIENVRKSPGGKINIPAEKESQSRSGFDNETDISIGGGYILYAQMMFARIGVLL